MLKAALYHLKRPFHLVKTGLLKGAPAEMKAGFPAHKLKILAITGTDGKTTSSTLLYHTLKQAGKKVALLSTVAAYIGDEEIDTGFHVTTPDPILLQKFMRRMVDNDYEYLVLEATSHGIYQYRLWGIQPLIVGITNITMEHLDYHVNYELYLLAKAELAKKAKTVVINADDELSFNRLKKEFRDTKLQVLTYSQQDPLPKTILSAIKTRFSEPYNFMNCRLVYTIAKQLDIEDKDIAAAIQKFPGVPGRMETIGEVKGVKVIVDFAHTSNGLYRALLAMRQQMKTEKRNGKLIAIFGCASQRDTQKRPVMGREGAEIADYAIFTAEDPRSENIWAIIRAMKQNLGPYHGKVLSIPDRREAIFFAVKTLAKSGDVIGVFGKGHEKSMCYGTKEYPWSDIDVTKEALAELKKSKKEG